MLYRVRKDSVLLYKINFFQPKERKGKSRPKVFTTFVGAYCFKKKLLTDAT